MELKMFLDRLQLEKELNEILQEISKPVIETKNYRVENGRVIVFDNIPKDKWLEIFNDETNIDVLQINNEIQIINTVRNVKILEKLGFIELPSLDGIKVARTWHPNGLLKTETWTFNNVVHREDGSAYAAWYDDGSKQTEAWYAYGVLHRLYGPSHTIWYENGMTFIEEYHVCGVNVVEKRDWLDAHNIPTLPLGWTNSQLKLFIENFQPKPTENKLDSYGDTGMNFGEAFDDDDDIDEDLDHDHNHKSTITELSIPITQKFDDKIILKKG